MIFKMKLPSISATLDIIKNIVILLAYLMAMKLFSNSKPNKSTIE